MTQLQVFKGVFIAIAVVAIYGVYVMLTHATVMETVELTAEQIIEEDDKHYILHADRKLKMKESFQQQIDLETYKTYKLVYSYNTLFDGRGEIERVEVYGGYN